MRKHMNDIQKAKVIALYQKNDKLKCIADRLNVSKSGIKRLIEYITMCTNNGFTLIRRAYFLPPVIFFHLG